MIKETESQDSRKRSAKAVEAAVSKVAVAVYAEHLGRGPTQAQSFLKSEICVCVLRDTMVTSERTLIESGNEVEMVRSREVIREAMRMQLVAAVEAEVERPVARRSQAMTRKATSRSGRSSSKEAGSNAEARDER